jgi:anaerobic selenocysteine-containing dehydrogenase
VARTQHFNVCRFCSNYCPVLVDVEDGRIVKIQGDRENPIWKGHTCIRGRVQHLRMAHPDRLLHSQKRRPDGSFEPIPVEQAMDEIAAKLREIIDESGPNAIAAYNGTFFLSSSTHGVTFEALMHALGSSMSFTPNTIDKPGKGIARALMGNWMAPPTGFIDPEVVLMVGVNPLVSYSGIPNGCPSWLNDVMRDGTQLIVIDPRRTETAQRASLHLQIRPGSDIALLAAMLGVILREGLHDREFIAENVANLGELSRALEQFTPELAAGASGLPAEQIVDVARTFGRSRKGFVIAGTGPNFTGHGTLLEYVCLALDTVTGHWLREGDRIPVVPVLLPERTYKAQSTGPTPARIEPTLKARGLKSTPAGAPTAALPDEILLEGEGRVRALISSAGSPVSAWPDQQRTVQAMKHLELLVQIDPWMTNTSRLAHYVIAPKMTMEFPATTHLLEYYSGHVAGYGMTETFAAYSPALVDPPEGSDLVEEWEFFYGIAKRLGLQLALAPTFGLVSLASAAGQAARVPLDMEAKPTSDELIELMCSTSRVPLAEVKKHTRGTRFPDDELYVQPKDPGWAHRFDVGNAEMLAELGDIAGEARVGTESEYPFRLLPRRNRGMYNASVNDGLSTRGLRHNPAFMHPDDLAELRLEPGDLVSIESAAGAVLGIVERDPALRPGLVSMAHAFGDVEPARDRETYLAKGSNTSVLLEGTLNCDPFSGQPQMGNIPVRVTRAEPALATIATA